ncbi:hypothetical protein [Frankia sp. Cj3]|uniref:hypothetical protein n=1 Tax=Frankia sp. Cj3 TaxID=2880976 RepID=UPI001EF6E1E5|nr:hypothetical protein [Frankia sp. Cj3]
MLGLGWSPSLPGSVAVVLVTATLIGFLSWVVGSDARTRRLARLLHSRRGDQG